MHDDDARAVATITARRGSSAKSRCRMPRQRCHQYDTRHAPAMVCEAMTSIEMTLPALGAVRSMSVAAPEQAFRERADAGAAIFWSGASSRVAARRTRVTASLGRRLITPPFSPSSFAAAIIQHAGREISPPSLSLCWQARQAVAKLAREARSARAFSLPADFSSLPGDSRIVSAQRAADGRAYNCFATEGFARRRRYKRYERRK